MDQEPINEREMPCVPDRRQDILPVESRPESRQVFRMDDLLGVGAAKEIASLHGDPERFQIV